MKKLTFITLLTVLLVYGCEETPRLSKLPQLNAGFNLSVSGISSGGYMAGQYQIAYSSEVLGSAIVAAGPWSCAFGDLSRAMNECLSGSNIELASLANKAKQMADDDHIDQLKELENQKTFIFRGSNDAYISDSLVKSTYNFFSMWQKKYNIKMVSDLPSNHSWITDNYGSECESFGSPYIVNCDYDLAGELLQHLHGSLNTPTKKTSTPVAFSQSEFNENSFAETGYVYIPHSCKSKRCSIHVFLHGCNQSANIIGTQLVENAGFNEWAETNDIIVLYPQIAPSTFSPINPLGCWDWWGYSSTNYLYKQSPQLSAIHAMVERLRQIKRQE